MTELLLIVGTALVVGLPCYFLGRMVGEERGYVMGMKRAAHLRRLQKEGGTDVLR